MKIKIFSDILDKNLENKVNDWLENTDNYNKVIEIKYSSDISKSSILIEYE